MQKKYLVYNQILLSQLIPLYPVFLREQSLNVTLNPSLCPIFGLIFCGARSLEPVQSSSHPRPTHPLKKKYAFVSKLSPTIVEDAGNFYG